MENAQKDSLSPALLLLMQRESTEKKGRPHLVAPDAMGD